MLDILTMATCVAYEAHVEKLDRLYPGAWHLIVAADDLGRSEHLVRLRVSVNLDIANGTKEPMGWAVESPWECLFRMLVKDSSFWAEQVHVPANAWLAHGSKGKPLTPAEAVAAASIQGGINAIKPDTEIYGGNTIFGTKDKECQKKRGQTKAGRSRWSDRCQEEQRRWEGQRKRERKAAGALCLEQQQWGLCWLTTRCRLPRKGVKGACLHQVRLSGTPVMSMPSERRLIAQLQMDWCCRTSTTRRGLDVGADDNRTSWKPTTLDVGRFKL